MRIRIGRHRGAAGVCLIAGITGVLMAFGASPAEAEGDLGLGGAQAQQSASGSVTVEWTVTGSDSRLTGFTVRRVESDVSTVVASVGTAVRKVDDPLAHLAVGGHLVSYEIVAQGPSGELVKTATFPPILYKAVPGGPASVDITTDGAAVTLRWKPPTVNAGLLKSYRVQRRADPATAFVTVAASSHATTLTDRVPGLAVGVHQVEYLITSLGSAADGGASEFSAATFVGVPSWPERVTARMAFDGGAGIIEWTPPAQNAKLVTGFRISRATDGGGQDSLASVGAAVRRYVDNGLVNVPAGTFVNYTVTALTSAADGGDGPAGLDVVHTPLAFVAAAKVTRGKGSVVISWPIPTAAAVPAGYRLRCRLNGSDTWADVAAAVVDPAARKATIAGANGQVYEVQISAVDPVGGGQSAWSSSIRALVGVALAAGNGISPAAGVTAAQPSGPPMARASAGPAGRGYQPLLVLAATAIVAGTVIMSVVVLRRARRQVW